MKLSDFDYNLPAELIAQEPMEPRDACRLLVLNKNSGAIEHRNFYDIGEYLRPGDLLVLNNTKVFKARLIGELGGKKVEIFLVRPISLPLPEGERAFGSEAQARREGVGEIPLHLSLCERERENNPSIPPHFSLVRRAGQKGRIDGCWIALGKPGRRLKIGETVKIPHAPFGKGGGFERGFKNGGDEGDFFCRIISKNESGELVVDFGRPVTEVIELANKYGHIPVPPYIKKEPEKMDEYQTVYAAKIGSVAAPTAGFHFTENLISKLKERGIEFAEITLHVGLGTFLPIREDEISRHKMHAEWVEISSEAAEKINAAKKDGRRIIAVGTTTVRAIEGVAASKDYSNVLQNIRIRNFLFEYSGFMDLFIQPGFEFKIIDGLITNFHLPKSTLLVLVSAFAKATADKSALAGRDKILAAYNEAVRKKYRFYSFGDAMLII